MAHFEFLETPWDMSNKILSLEGESWEQALRAHLMSFYDENLDNIEDIYRIQDNKFVSCKSEIVAEQNRRKQALLMKEQAEEEAKERALYEKLAAKFAPKV